MTVRREGHPESQRHRPINGRVGMAVNTTCIKYSLPSSGTEKCQGLTEGRVGEGT